MVTKTPKALKIKRSNPKKRPSFLWLIIPIVLLVLGVSFVNFGLWSKDIRLNRQKAALPAPIVSSVESTKSGIDNARESLSVSPATQTAVAILDELNLAVAFSSQAPSGNWDKTHEEACEEAAILMAGRYYQGRGIADSADAEQGLQEIIGWEMQNLGFFESTSVAQTEQVIRGVYGLKTQSIKNPTVEQIKSALAQDRLVLMPEAGRELGNPFYIAPGPLYHFLLIKGYTRDKFITNDAGTKRGENYPYYFGITLDANHDYNGGDVAAGARKAIVVYK